MLSHDEAYALGFLACCAERGLTAQEASALHKQANLRELASGGLFSALATGTVLGGGVGAGLGMLARPDPLRDTVHPLVRNVQQAEILAALRQSTLRAKRQAEILRARAAEPAPRNVFGI